MDSSCNKLHILVLIYSRHARCLPSAITLFISLFIDILFVVLHVAEGCLLNLESKYNSL